MTDEQPRKLDILLKLEYSEMTNEEIELVIDYKADIKVRDETFQKQQEDQQAAMAEIVAVHRETAEKCKSHLSDLVKQATDRLAND